jgi:hypothetical protein
MRILVIWAFLATASSVYASGPLVQIHGAPGDGVPEISVSPSTNQFLDVTLDLAGDLADGPHTLLSWQLALEVTAVDDASGAIKSESAMAHVPPFLGSESEFQVLSATIGPSIVFQELDPTVTGTVLSPGSTAGMTTIQLSISPDAAGVFAVTMLPYDPDDLDHSSFWFDGELFEEKEFGNVPELSGSIELLRIRVQAAATTGDYNDDEIVDAADYTVWRDGLGTNFTPGHYQTWKNHFGEVTAPNSTGIAVPEPSCGPIIIVAGICFRTTRRRSRASSVLAAERAGVI